MRKVKIGDSNLQINPLGIGCWAIGGECIYNSKACGWSGTDDRESKAALQKALDMGIDYIDTANFYGYGHSESLIGEVIKNKRDKVVISTKFGYLVDGHKRVIEGESTRSEDIKAACHDSLRRLGTDYIDLYFFHLGDSSQGEAVLTVLDELVKEGKIRYYGWSTENPINARIFAQSKHCIAMQYPSNLFNVNRDILDVCQQYNLANVIRDPLHRGLLTGKFTFETVFSESDLRHDWDFSSSDGVEALRKLDDLRDLLTVGGRTFTQGAICWLWSLGLNIIPIPGFRTTEQIQENVEALDFGTFASNQLREINKIIFK